jgi:Putative DNA-binding domain
VTGQGAFAAALLDPGAPCPDGLRAWNGSDPAARFAVYRNNVVHSLVDALAETFPVSRELVGDEFFRAMARVFVLASPPRSRVLATYGEWFPGCVERFEPARTVPYLADVARLEMARVRAFHAADARPVEARAIADALAAPDLAPMLRVTCHPSLSVIRSSYAVVSLWAAHQGIGDIADVDPDDAEDALVVRRGLEVEVVGLPAGGAAFVQDLLAGRSLGDATARACAEERAFDLAAILTLLMRVDAIATLALTERQSP